MPRGAPYQNPDFGPDLQPNPGFLVRVRARQLTNYLGSPPHGAFSRQHRPASEFQRQSPVPARTAPRFPSLHCCTLRPWHRSPLGLSLNGSTNRRAPCALVGRSSVTGPTSVPTAHDLKCNAPTMRWILTSPGLGRGRRRRTWSLDLHAASIFYALTTLIPTNPAALTPNPLPTQHQNRTAQRYFGRPTCPFLQTPQITPPTPTILP